MVCIIIDDGDAAQRTFVLETAFGAAAGSATALNGLCVDAKTDGHGNYGQSAWHVEWHSRLH